MGANFANSFSVTPSLTMSNWNRLRYRSQRNFALDKPFTCLPNFAKICDAETGRGAVWLARGHREPKVAGSSPAAPTTFSLPTLLFCPPPPIGLNGF